MRLTDEEMSIIDRPDPERVRFIRQAAIAFAVVYEQYSEQRSAGLVHSPRHCWSRAQELWDEKPEDC